ncbi:MAG TPA: peptide chain release factor N(5)-glutamine methyltransferase [Candidatus Saccharimonadales bacterium]|nr:peptide chain release factor N(5)-glutamine methyltransferase [Candidatus Saccharimonadales bacterium]
MNQDTPQAYIDGFVYFCGLKFIVTSDTLIPRPETEQLVNSVVDFAKDHKDISIVDVGTGSGCIAILIAKKIPQAKITAIDVSEKALEIAKQNAQNHVVDITFLQNDLLANVKTKFDVIVANLPYIPSERIPNLDNSVKDFEPLHALDGGADGFDLYRKLFSQIISNNIQPDFLACEINDDQEDIALEESTKYFPNARIVVQNDSANLNRYLYVWF